MPDPVKSFSDIERHGKALAISLDSFAPYVSGIHKEIYCRPPLTKSVLII